MDGYRKIAKNWIIPFLGKVDVREVDARVLNRFLNRIATEPKKRHYKDGVHAEPDAKPISGTMQAKVFQQIHQLFDFAVRNGIIASNPADRVAPPRKDSHEAAILEIEDMQKLFALMEGMTPQWKAVFSLLLFSGMRPSELCGLNWADLQGNLLNIRAGSYKPKGQPTQRTSRPKTRGSVRDILLSSDVLAALTAHQAAQQEMKETAGDDWPDRAAMFTDTSGRRISLSTIQSHWTHLCAKNGLPKVGIYSLRHSATSLMILEGLSVRDIASRLGHSTPALVLSTYSHSFADANERATAAITAAFEKIKRGEK